MRTTAPRCVSSETSARRARWTFPFVLTLVSNAIIVSRLCHVTLSRSGNGPFSSTVVPFSLTVLPTLPRQPQHPPSAIGNTGPRFVARAAETIARAAFSDSTKMVGTERSRKWANAPRGKNRCRRSGGATYLPMAAPLESISGLSRRTR